ncbi:MAG: DUF1801 domain-containing protein, partial [Halobacteriovoraceae bacterium]|nr:DUF1801 domain-containing protein [Halobacteriovoraceae bacterium]
GIIKKLRKIILQAFPDIVESFKNGVPWYEDEFYIVGLKDHVNLGFSISRLNKQEMNLLEGKGKIMRHLKYFSIKEVDEEKIVKLLKIVDKKHRSCH